MEKGAAMEEGMGGRDTEEEDGTQWRDARKWGQKAGGETRKSKRGKVR